MYMLKTGTILYHGTDNSDFDEESSNPNPYSWFSTSRAVAERFAKRSGGWGGQKRVIEYCFIGQVELHEITSAGQMRDFAEKYNIDLSSTEDMRNSAEEAGIDGWIIPSNYPDGDDILLGETGLLDYLGTTLLDIPGTSPRLASRPPAPAADAILRMANSLDACSSILQSSAYTPVRSTELLLRAVVRENLRPREVDGFNNLIKDLRKFANTVANPARQRMQDAAAMLENLNDAGVCY